MRYGTITMGTCPRRTRLTATEPTTRCLALDELTTTIATLSAGWASRICRRLDANYRRLRSRAAGRWPAAPRDSDSLTGDTALNPDHGSE